MPERVWIFCPPTSASSSAWRPHSWPIPSSLRYWPSPRLVTAPLSISPPLWWHSRPHHRRDSVADWTTPNGQSFWHLSLSDPLQWYDRTSDPPKSCSILGTGDWRWASWDESCCWNSRVDSTARQTSGRVLASVAGDRVELRVGSSWSVVAARKQLIIRLAKLLKWK